MTQTLDATLESMNRYISDIQQVLNQVAAGDLRTGPQVDFGLKGDILNILGDLCNLLGVGADIVHCGGQKLRRSRPRCGTLF